MWRTRPETVKQNNQLLNRSDITGFNQQNHSTQSNGMSFTMIFASIFGSFVGIALISRLFGPRRVEVVHKRSSYDENGFDSNYPPPGGPYRSV